MLFCVKKSHKTGVMRKVRSLFLSNRLCLKRIYRSIWQLFTFVSDNSLWLSAAGRKGYGAANRMRRSAALIKGLCQRLGKIFNGRESRRFLREQVFTVKGKRWRWLQRKVYSTAK